MSGPSVELKKALPSGTIILNRPERRNALSRGMMDAIEQALADFHQEKKIRAVILTGAGSAFCAGMDLSEMHQTSQLDEADALEQWYEDAVQFRDLLQTMLQFPKPIIAAVNGPAVAGGAGLVLAADLVVAAPEAKFGFPEPRRGLVAGVVAPLLAFRAGGAHASRLLLSAEIVDAEYAYRAAIYHEMVSSHLIWARAQELAETCAKNAPQAIQLTKQMLNETIGEELATLLSAGASVSATARTTSAAEEGLAAFLEKREPDWS